MGGCWGGCWWAAAGAAAGVVVGGCWGGCWGGGGQETPEVPVLPVYASGLGSRKRRCTVRSQKIEMDRDGMV